MDDQTAEALAALAWLLPLGLVALAIVWSRGWLSPHALDRGPSRVVGLGPADALIGIGLFVVGGTLLAFAVRGVLGVDPTTGRVRDPSIHQQVALVTLSQLLTQGPPVAFLVWRAGRRPWGLRRVGLVPRRPLRELGLGLLAFALVIPITLAMLGIGAAAGAWLGAPPPPLAHELLDTLTSPEATPLVRIALAVSVIFVGPALEEAIYRGLLQSSLVEAVGRRRRWPVVLGVSALFAVMHAQVVAAHTLPALFVLGVAFGWLYERTGSLWPSIILHACFNAFNVGAALLMQHLELTQSTPPV